MSNFTCDTQAGQKFAGSQKHLSMERLWTFSGGPFTLTSWPQRNTHTDPETARAQGLPDVIVPGNQYQGYVVQLLIDLFGTHWLTYGTMTVRFVAPVHCGDTVQAWATIRERETIDHQQIRFVLDVWCENQNGQQVMVGTATGRVTCNES